LSEQNKKDAYFFPHFYNARHDRKVKRIRKDLGIEGYGIFFMLLEVLREQTDFKFPVSDIDLLADEFGTSVKKIEEVIGKYDLFIVDEDRHFFSPKLVFYLQPYFEKIEHARMMANKRWNKCKSNDAIALPQYNQSIVIELPQQCSSNAMVMQGDIGDIGDINKKDMDIFFDKLWSLYPCKKGKGKIKDAQKKRLFNIGLEALTLCIERYKTTKKDWTEWQYGSTFFNSGYIDYLDENFQEQEENREEEEILL